MKKPKTPTVFFNASVVLAGLKSPTGGSAKLLTWSRKKIITGILSEVILDEILRNAAKLGLGEKESIISWSKTIFSQIVQAPKRGTVDLYKTIVIDEGDAHVLASCRETKARFLVTLDKKHLLSLREKVKGIKIVTPGELIEFLSRKKRPLG